MFSFFLIMIPQPPSTTLTDTLVPYTTLCRSCPPGDPAAAPALPQLAPRSLGRSRIIFPKLAARGGVERPHHAIARRGIENPVHRHRAGHRIAERQVDRTGKPQTANRVAVDLVRRAVMLLAKGPPEGRPVRDVRPVEP